MLYNQNPVKPQIFLYHMENESSDCMMVTQWGALQEESGTRFSFLSQTNILAQVFT